MGDFDCNLRDNDGDAADFVHKITSLVSHLPRFHHTYMDDHGHSELDILASFDLSELQPRTGSSALVGGHDSLIVHFQKEALPGTVPVTHPPMRQDWSGYTSSAHLLALQDLDWTMWNNAQTTSALTDIVCENISSAVNLCASLVSASKRTRKFRAKL